MIEAVIFDLDGVLIDSEGAWNAARKHVTLEHGGKWTAAAQRDMMGMSSTEWSGYMQAQLGVRLPASEINSEVVARMGELYRSQLPLMPDAQGAVRRLADRWPLAVASSANRELIDLVLELAGLDRLFVSTVSSEEVPQGKPAPDVYLAACAALGRSPGVCAGVEDSTNGLLAAGSAGMWVIAVPNPTFRPSEEAIAASDVVLKTLSELDADVIDALEA